MPLDWSPLWLSLRYAGCATLLSTMAALPLAWLLARRTFPGRELLDAAANLPLLAPPAVLAYYLLARLGRWRLVFHWRAAVILSALYTLPLVLRIFRAGLEAISAGFENAARSLGAGEWRIFWRVTLPLSWRALVAALLMGFARAFVDFAATALVASAPANAWIVALVAATALATLYMGNRLYRGRAWA